VILVDSSVWIDHFRKSGKHLSALLDTEAVCIHPYILGELACGNFKNRQRIIALLRTLPAVHKASNEEILYFIEQHRLDGRGIGLIDVHLLASCLTDKCCIWTFDRRLREVAEALNIAYSGTDHDIMAV
jgi:predicted nucleic acid-binding protein